MHRIITLACILLFCTKTSKGQTHTSDSILTSIEMEYFICPNDSLKNELLYTKLNVYVQNNLINQDALKETKRIDAEYLSGKNKNNYLWNASVISYLNKDIFYSLHYINKYEKNNIADTSFDFLLLKLLIYSSYDTTIANSIRQKINKKNIQNVDCLKCLVELESYELKNKKLFERLSVYLPGSGLIANGNILKGFISMGINTGTVLTIRYFFLNQAYINMFAWGTNLITKFYLGNVTLTSKMVQKKERIKKQKLATNCEFVLSNILREYPILFK